LRERFADEESCATARGRDEVGAIVGHSGGSRAALAVAGGCRKEKLNKIKWMGWGLFLLAVDY